MVVAPPEVKVMSNPAFIATEEAVDEISTPLSPFRSALLFESRFSCPAAAMFRTFAVEMSTPVAPSTDTDPLGATRMSPADSSVTPAWPETLTIPACEVMAVFLAE